MRRDMELSPVGLLGHALAVVLMVRILAYAYLRMTILG